ncbi:MAG: PAS domain-containing sensor histidine kinase [Alphaproteobacteria bacterium]|nr:PAS domain-containing sensor histidine kinase [Alphaproteobacteria bacterium]
MSTERVVRWSKLIGNFWEEASEKSISPNVVVSYSCRSQSGEGFEELINSLNSKLISRKISHVHIWDTSYLYRHSIPEFEQYADPSVETKWFKTNEKIINKLKLPHTLHSWTEGLDSPLFAEWLEKVKIAFAGDETGNGIIPDFREIVLEEAEKATIRANGTFVQNVSFILEECAYTCLYFKNSVIIYPTKLSPPIANIIQHYHSNITHLPYTMSNNAQRRQHRSLDRNEINCEIIEFITKIAKNINFFVINKDGTIVYKNESLGKIVSDTDATALNPKTWENSLEVINTKSTIVVEEADKGRFFLSVKSPLMVNNEIEGVIGLSIDITDSKKIEQEKEKIIKLEFLNKIQQAKIDLQTEFSQFISQMAHDIASPLASLRVFTHSCSNLTERQQKMLTNITKDIRSISDDLLQENKRCRENFEKQDKRRVSIFSVLQDEIKQKKLEYRATDVNIGLSFEPSAKSAIVDINVSDFKRMISNLVNNAIESGRHKDSVSVKLLLYCSGKNLAIEVEDNGKGMPKEMTDQIRNNIAPKSTKPNGFGLGLVQILETIKRYNGELDITSIEGKGTKFSIKFPMVDFGNAEKKFRDSCK